MSGPSCKIYFTTEEEYWAIVKIAASHDMTLPQFVHSSVIEVSNSFLARLDAEKQRQQDEADLENTVPAEPASETDVEEASAESEPTTENT